MKILILNPNISEEMTQAIGEVAASMFVLRP